MKFAIIGAGIGGLATALAFEKKGIDYQIFEATPQFREVGAGIWLAPNALQVLESLGILEEVKTKGNTIDRITLGKADLSPLSDTYQNTVKEKFGYTTVAIHRAALQHILFNKIPSNKIHLGKSFGSYAHTEDEKIKVVFEDKSEYETDYIIGADGIHSKVRKQLFPNSTTRYTGQTCWRGVATIDMPQEFHHRGIELWGDQVRFGVSKIADNKVYWFAVALDQPNQKDNAETIQQKLLNMFNGFHPIIKELIRATPTELILRNDIIDLKPMKTWYKENICLIGDAGHATTPNMGQGGAQAIEDAYYLSELIANNPDQNIFEKFLQKRQPKVNDIVNQSWSTGKMAHWKYGKSIRNFFLKNIPQRMVQKKMMEMYTIEKVI
ncbi:FAD-dependent monooxygenase [Aquimarina sp. D1M17]|uniref:FAD-dependent monooxygenase n=1 Tax=Aquimarina acroporae TaxID=2937283 RepID=UPI0020BD8BA2|nr:FAD-dependent monooxygenase [Aquimarina acroporae]MCK8522981.1 FAD-dependent monooxygenase [Aquimarina acroporae]